EAGQGAADLEDRCREGLDRAEQVGGLVEQGGEDAAAFTADERLGDDGGDVSPGGADPVDGTGERVLDPRGGTVEGGGYAGGERVECLAGVEAAVGDRLADLGSGHAHLG